MKFNEEDIEFAGQILTDRHNLDKKQVNEWMDDSEHVEMLKEFAAIRQKCAPMDFKYDEAEYRRLERCMPVRKPRRLVAYWPAAASVVLLAGMLAGWMLFRQRLNRKEVGVVQTERLMLRDHKVELILSGGEVVELGKSDRRVDGVVETGIRNDSLQGLSYANARMSGQAEGEDAYNTLKIPTCGFYQLELGDGTKIWLNAETELRYPVEFRGEERKVFLSGEAYFKVMPDKKRPFIVMTEKEMSVKVYGTEFNVNTYNGGEVQTTLVSGKVGIEVLSSGKEYMLSPHEIADYSEVSGDVTVKKTDTYAYTAWKDGKFVFENETIEEIMQRLCRWYDCEVFFSGQQSREHRFSGIITRFSDLSDVLYLIGETAEVKFEIRERLVIVK